MARSLPEPTPVSAARPAPLRWLGEAVRRARGSSARAGTLALADQLLVSGTNFATGLLLARALSPAGYGAYALVIAALLGMSSLQTALLTGPLTVLAPREGGPRRSGYLSSLWALQLGVAAAAGVALLLFLGLAPRLTGGQMLSGLLAAALAGFAFLSQEFVRRALFCYSYPGSALTIDLIGYGLQLGALGALSAAGRLSFAGALWVIGLTSLLAAAAGVLPLARHLGAVSRASLAGTCRRHWDFGRWLLWSSLANWSAIQIYAFVTAALLSPAATGLLMAGRQLLGLTHFFLLGLENFVPTAMTRRLLSDGVAGLVDWTRRFRVLSVTLVTAVCAPLALAADPLVRWLFGADYAGAALVVAISALGYVVIAANRPTMFALRAIAAPRWTFRANLAAALTSLVVSVPLVSMGGVAGAASGMVLANLVTFAVASAGFRRERRALGEGRRTKDEGRAASYREAVPGAAEERGGLDG